MGGPIPVNQRLSKREDKKHNRNESQMKTKTIQNLWFRVKSLLIEGLHASKQLKYKKEAKGRGSQEVLEGQ